eukprot:scaffold803_cov310-Pinguiococcus_pyrenoidosus.AAC.75
MQSDSSPPGEPEMPASEPPLPEAPPAFRKVTVRVPATTANMGPGFDCLGGFDASSRYRRGWL